MSDNTKRVIEHRGDRMKTMKTLNKSDIEAQRNATWNRWRVTMNENWVDTVLDTLDQDKDEALERFFEIVIAAQGVTRQQIIDQYNEKLGGYPDDGNEGFERFKAGGYMSLDYWDERAKNDFTAYSLWFGRHGALHGTDMFDFALGVPEVDIVRADDLDISWYLESEYYEAPAAPYELFLISRADGWFDDKTGTSPDGWILLGFSTTDGKQYYVSYADGMGFEYGEPKQTNEAGYSWCSYLNLYRLLTTKSDFVNLQEFVR